MLGVPAPKGELKTDADTLAENGVWCTEGLASNIKYSNGVFVNLLTGRSTYPNIQLDIDSSGSHFAFRIKVSNTWRAWLEIV